MVTTAVCWTVSAVIAASTASTLIVLFSLSRSTTTLSKTSDEERSVLVINLRTAVVVSIVDRPGDRPRPGLLDYLAMNDKLNAGTQHFQAWVPGLERVEDDPARESWQRHVADTEDRAGAEQLPAAPEIAVGEAPTSTGCPAPGGRCWPDPDDPPVWPLTFTANFQEILVSGQTVVTNGGTWFYDYGTKFARFDHDYPQNNNFCQGQNLSSSDPNADCHLLFTGTGDMWVIYPDARDCCRLCGAAEGCTILRPDWLKGGNLTQVEEIGGRPCAGWGKGGAVAAADTWYQDRSGVPCRYHEVVFGVLHNLTFAPDSYSTGPIPPRVFRVPPYCVDRCPNPFHSL